MKRILTLAILALFSIPAFGQSDLYTVFEGVRIKNSHRDEVLFYYRNNWARLREMALSKGFIVSYELVESRSPSAHGFDIGLVTRFRNETQYEQAETNFRSLIEERGDLKLLNEIKPTDFRENVFLVTGKVPETIAADNPLVSSTIKIKLENEGWELYGDYTVPVSSGPFPAVILLNKAFGTRGAYVRLAERLAKDGIASIRFDLRAHGESINKGKFGPPFDEQMRALLNGTDNDIAAIHRWAASQPKIDAKRIGFVGASYSGEEMVSAARKRGYGKAYIALSPGSFSEDSMKSIDRMQIPWFFIKSVDEIALMKDVFEDIRANSKSARILEVSGKKHATDILQEQPDVEEIIALWFRHVLYYDLS